MKNLLFSSILFCLILPLNLFALDDPLPSWNEGEAKKTLLDFVQRITDEKSAQYIPVKERLATFDQDGTLWVEQPIYTQFIFAIDRIKALAPQHPDWNTKEPFKTIISGDLQAISRFTIQDIEQMVAITHSGMSVEDFEKTVKEWLNHAVNPRYKKPYTQLIYQPMLEVIDLLKKHHFDVYIVSGGGQEFIRVYSDEVYGIPVENIIGTAAKVKYSYFNNQPALIKLPEVLFINDKAGKPEGINLIIGKRPVAAFGNSDGDREMLEWVKGPKEKSLRFLVHHDDPVREYAYGADSRVGTFSDSLMDEAKKREWVVVSMKNDWKVIFPFEVSTDDK